MAMFGNFMEKPDWAKRLILGRFFRLMGDPKVFFLVLVLLGMIGGLAWIIANDQETEEVPAMTELEREALKRPPFPDLGYQELHPPIAFENLRMIGSASLFGVTAGTQDDRLLGMMLRALRFENITLALESRYHLPSNLLLAMVMQETGGVDLLPNAKDDGGIGLCHMQPSTASEFGLRIYQDCRDLVNHEHGRALRALIAEHKLEKKTLIQFDDRFHPVLNLDAAARMMAYYMSGQQFKANQLQTGIYRYAGATNFDHYYKNVLMFMDLLGSPETRDRLAERFNQLNPGLRIDGDSAGFREYIARHHQINENYGLGRYR